MNQTILQPLNTELALNLPIEQIEAFCQYWQIQELYVFGSILRDDFCDDSDIDFLYSLSSTVSWSFSNLLRAEQDLSAIVGRDVDLVSKKSIDRDRNWLRRQNIFNSMRLVYVTK
ncbi:MAG: nucleotidyltransferase domain-containing protein [Pseudanabaena sp. ELA607]|jgi:predicted nucleotidyltransferase